MKDAAQKVQVLKNRFHVFTLKLQESICATLEKADGGAVFKKEAWTRPEGGGGISRVLSAGRIFEKAGVNTSLVHGQLPEVLQQTLGVKENTFFACGLSLVIHPLNPFVPTVHANWRYFELYNKDGIRKDSWFGGGTDLTPYYIFREDGRHFHTVLKNTMDTFGPALYPLYKMQCDEYFVNKHRDNEARGIGGVFYDYLRPEDEADAERLFLFQQANADAFSASYLPIVERRKNHPFSDKEIFWQEIRRGRYVEFNLIHDRGTLFGLKTNGRTESILMSLPPRARWEVNFQPAEGSSEAEMMKYLRPHDWVNMQ